MCEPIDNSAPALSGYGLSGLTGIYSRIGGRDGCGRLASAFYSRIKWEPALARLYPRHIDCPTRGLARYFTELLGGPPEHSTSAFFPALHVSHARFRIGAEERDAWLRVMGEALSECVVDAADREALAAFFEASSAFLVNVPDDGGVADRTALGDGRGDAISPSEQASDAAREMAARWRSERGVETIVAAARGGDLGSALALMDRDDIRGRCRANRPALLRLLGAIGGIGTDDALGYVVAQLDGDPSLVNERYGNGRTLLHEAAMHDGAAFARLLLTRGGDPNAPDEGGHAPLYYVAGPAVVAVLAQGGANMNAPGGVTKVTALHRAARFGQLTVAEALLECGADMAIEDSGGRTALQRARNCRKHEMVALLLSRGA